MKDRKFLMGGLLAFVIFCTALCINNYLSQRKRAAQINEYIEQVYFDSVFRDDAAYAQPFHTGGTLVINVWATWCRPCLEEIPELNRFAEEYDSEDIHFLAITNQEEEDVVEFKKDREKKKEKEPFQFDYSQRYDEGKLIQYLYTINPSKTIRLPEVEDPHEMGLFPRGVPLNIIIHKGKIEFFEVGASKSNIAEMEAVLTRLKGQPS